MLSRVKTIYCFVLFFFISNFCSSFLYAADFVDAGPPFINIEQISGEKLANVSETLRDSQGFIWLVNDSGLLRYDGNELTLFPGLEQFTSPNVDDIVEGQAGRLWIATLDKGLALFDKNSKKLTFFDLTETFEVAARADGNPAQVNMLTYKNKYLYLASKDTVLKINEKSLTVAQRYYFPIEKSETISRFLITSTGDVWCSTDQGYGVYRLNTQGLTHFKHQPDNITSISSAFVTSIYEDSQNRIWFGGIAGLDLFFPESNSFLSFAPLDLSSETHKDKGKLANFVLTIVEDKEKVLWLGLLRNGVVKFIPDSKVFEHYPHINGVSSTLLSNTMFDGVSLDNQQTLWVSTNNGLSKLPKNNRKISQLVNVDKDNCNPLAMHDSKQGLLFACNKTLYRLYQQKVELVEKFNEKILSIYQQDENYLWLGTLGGGVYRYNLATNTTKHYGFTSDINEHIGVNLVIQLRADFNGDLYGLTVKHAKSKGFGLIRYNEVEDEFLSYATELDLAAWVDINQKKMLLVASISNNTKKLYWFDKKSQNIEKLPIATGRVLAIVKWQQQLWVSTEEQGLIAIDMETGQWHKLTKDSNDIITGFYLGPSSEKLYLTINNQLYKFNSILDGKMNNQCITCSIELNYTVINHNHAGQLFKNNSILTKTNQFFISSDNKLLAFPIEELQSPNTKSQLLLTNFKIKGKSILPTGNSESALLTQSIEQTKYITIPPQTTFFSFSFSKVGANQPEKIKYAYKMEGLNTDWVNVSSNHAQAHFSLLPAGNYTFKVKASDDNGQWQSAPPSLSVDITVLPPWWHTWWAYCFYFSGIFYFFWLFYRTKLAEKERQATLELVNAKEQLFANISHEFRTPLTLILGPAKIIKTSCVDDITQHNAHLIERNALRLLSMVDQLLQLAQLKSSKKKNQ